MLLRRKAARAALVAVAVLSNACQTERASEPEPNLEVANAAPAAPGLANVVRTLAVQRGIPPLDRPAAVREPLVALGQALLFDKVLSGNRDISCMTCHLPPFATGDSRSLSIGQGATGLGPVRVHPKGAFIPRNAPSLFNLAALKSLFWDGRVSIDPSGQISTPAGSQLTPAMAQVFEFGPASALGLFPVTSRSEMRADDGNELAQIADTDLQGIWRALMARLGAIPKYRQMFEAAYPGTKFEQMTFAHASNAMGGFMLSRLSFNNTPWDRFLHGDDGALSAEQMTGAQTFLSIRCSLCHNGPAFTDNKFHNVALAQFGPGEGDGLDGRDDFGRMRVTGSLSDKYLFRTTPLRNVVLTGPYGHDGAFADLRTFIDHYSESELKLRSFDPMGLEPLLRGTVLSTFDEILATRDTILNGVVLPSTTVGQLMAFMTALTDPTARDLTRLIPGQVPSGLPIDRGR